MRYDDDDDFMDIEAETNVWAEGFHAGKAEVLETLVPEALELVAAYRASDEQAEWPLEDLVQLVERWAAHFEALNADD